MEKPVTITVKTSPGAHESKVTRFADGIWYLKIAAPAVRGKANEELVRFLSAVLKVSKDNIVIGQGLSSRRKLIRIRGITIDDITERLGKLL